MINLLIVDDHPVVRDGLKRLFSHVSDVSIVAEAVDGAGAIEMLERGMHFDLVLLDLVMPGVSGVDFIAHLNGVGSTTPVLVLSMQTELQVAKRVLNMGVSGYITKGCSSELLIEAIRKVAAGGRFVDPVLVEQMVDAPAVRAGTALHDRLSARELDILKLIAGGHSGNEIADKLAISNKTVSTHKTRLMQKMNFRSEIDLLRYALEHGLAA